MRFVPIAACFILILSACEPQRQAATAPRTKASTTEPPPSASATPRPIASAAARDAAPAPAERRFVVRLLPIGDVAQDTIEKAAAGVESHGPIRAIVEKRLPLPPETMSSQKGRYRSELLLDWIAKLDLPAGGKILGITDVDIVAHKGNAPNWGVLGLGAIDGRMCVISTFRMKRKKGGGTVSEDVVTERLWKTAVHEVGHTIGIEHCPVGGCLMHDGMGTVFTTDEEHDFCPRCASRFASAAAEHGQAGVSER
jgi:archaemetzincin